MEDPEPTTEITAEDHGTAGARDRRRRPIDATSLVAGLVVLAIAAAFAFGDPDTLRDQGRIIGPVALLGIGAALLIGSLDR